jgi:UDP-2-acetamido-2,6-beta-L-arabino-hexul-4-ose reductase
MTHNSSAITHHSLRIGITGQAGFVGTHLFNFFGLQENLERISFEDKYFETEETLNNFVKRCDVIVHLAAMNRHGNPQVIYDTNISLVKKLIVSCETTNSKPHILFSSSTQEERDNLYGKSKLDGRKLLEEWALKNNAQFTGLIIPNVFGPFGNPYYNSFIATFCYQLTHGETPKIDVDGEVKLIYIEELVNKFYNKIKDKSKKIKKEDTIESYKIPFTSKHKVSEILTLLKSYKENYFEQGIFPDLNDTFERNLFNTFVCYIDIKNHYPVKLKLNTDDRGSFVETVKLQSGGQVSFSTTKSGITRGNHFHIRKAERFAVIKGKARIQLRKIGTDEVLNFDLDGNEPSYVDMPIWYTHNITNIGNEEVYTIFWISEFFNPEDPDTYFENV